MSIPLRFLVGESVTLFYACLGAAQTALHEHIRAIHLTILPSGRWLGDDLGGGPPRRFRPRDGAILPSRCVARWARAQASAHALGSAG